MDRSEQAAAADATKDIFKNSTSACQTQDRKNENGPDPDPGIPGIPLGPGGGGELEKLYRDKNYPRKSAKSLRTLVTVQ